MLSFYCVQSCNILVIFTGSSKQINISVAKSFETFDLAIIIMSEIVFTA